MNNLNLKTINNILSRIKKLEKNSVILTGDSIKRGINMKCECCSSEGFHYHYIDCKILKRPNHADTNNVCQICKENPGKFHYHFDCGCGLITQNEPTIFSLCPIKEINMNPIME